MPARKALPPDAKPQIERFKELARELGCDEDEAAFEAALARIVSTPAQPKYEPKRRQPKG